MGKKKDLKKWQELLILFTVFKVTPLIHFYWQCHSQHGNQMRAPQTSDCEWSYALRAPSLSPSISLATLAGNLVRKLFCVCLWTMQSEVRLIQKETQHRRRSRACSDDCCYSVGEYFPLLHFHFRKLRQGILINLSQRRRGDLLRRALKLLFTFKKHPVIKVLWPSWPLRH